RLINVSDIGEVLGLVFVLRLCLVLRHQLGRRGNRLVRLVKTNEEKKGRLPIALVFQPADGFVACQLAGESRQGSDRFAVANEVLRILMRWSRVVLGAEPMIEA